MCYVKPHNVLDPIARQGAFYQHMITRVIRFYMKDMSRFERANPYYSFVSNLSWKLFFNLRAYIQAYNVIELTTWEDLATPKGLWITAKTRSHDHDIVVFYVPNFPFFGSQPYFYAEYMATMHSLLLLQGFNSPAVFVMEFSEHSKRATMEANLFCVVDSWKKLTNENPNAKFVIAGESLGATLVLRFLLYCNKMFEAANVAEEEIPVVKPFGAFVISPIVDFSPQNLDFNMDYFRPDNVQAITEFACKDQAWSPLTVLDANAWSVSMPKGGFILISGAEEFQAESIDLFSRRLSATGMAKIVSTPKRGHCWPFVSFLTEEVQDEKEDSCFLIAGMLSRMVLFHTTTYKDPRLAFEPMNLLTIDDDHL